MKVLLLTVAGLTLIGFSVYRIMVPQPITAAQSMSANYLLLDLLTTLATGVIGIICLFIAYRVKRKERREQQLIRKWERDFGK